MSQECRDIVQVALQLQEEEVEEGKDSGESSLTERSSPDIRWL